MLDINLLRNDPDKVRENIRKKFQDEKLPMVDEVISMDREFRDAIQQGDNLRNKRKTLSKQIGGLLARGEKEEAERVKAEVASLADELAQLEVSEEELKLSRRRKSVLARPTMCTPPWAWTSAAHLQVRRLRPLHAVCWSGWAAH